MVGFWASKPCTRSQITLTKLISSKDISLTHQWTLETWIIRRNQESHASEMWQGHSRAEPAKAGNRRGKQLKILDWATGIDTPQNTALFLRTSRRKSQGFKASSQWALWVISQCMSTDENQPIEIGWSNDYHLTSTPHTGVRWHEYNFNNQVAYIPKTRKTRILRIGTGGLPVWLEQIFWRLIPTVSKKSDISSANPKKTHGLR